MPQPVLRSAQSIAEFIEIIDRLKPRTSAGLWFRGQSNATFRLLPGALRDTHTLTDGLGRLVKPGQIIRARGGLVSGPSPEHMLAAFKRQARPFAAPAPTNDFEWMFLAQHHGLKTRLLDWSTNALASLYFGASGAKIDSANDAETRGDEACADFEAGNEFRNDGFAIFVIEPGIVNEAGGHGNEPIDIAAFPDEWARYLDPMSAGLSAYLPICISAPHISPRIRAQSGSFTLHGANIDPIDYYDELRPNIVKIFIPYTATARIQHGLRLLGITSSYIYPGLDTIAQDINEAEHSRYTFDRAASPPNEDD